MSADATSRGAYRLGVSAVGGDVPAEVPLDDVSEVLVALFSDFAGFVPDGSHAEAAHGGLAGWGSSWLDHEASLPSRNTEIRAHLHRIHEIMLLSYYINE
jgi:hypothetical protein